MDYRWQLRREHLDERESVTEGEGNAKGWHRATSSRPTNATVEGRAIEYVEPEMPAEGAAQVDDDRESVPRRRAPTSPPVGEVALDGRALGVVEGQIGSWLAVAKSSPPRGRPGRAGLGAGVVRAHVDEYNASRSRFYSPFSNAAGHLTRRLSEGLRGIWGGRRGGLASEGGFY